MRNNNRKVIRRLSNRSLRKNRMRNIFLVAAIALTALLFTTLFSLGSGVVQMTQEQTMRQIGTKAHAGLKHVTREQYEKIASHPLVKEHSYNIFIGGANNQELTKRQTEIRYTEKKDLEYGFVSLKEGRFPDKEKEIVVDTAVMDLLDVPHELGAEITLSFPFLGKDIKDTFIISGWYQTDMVAMASEVYVSKIYLDKISEGYTEQDFVKSYHSNFIGAGLLNASFMFRNSRNIEENMIKIITESGYSAKEINYGINWAYFSEKMQDIDLFSVLILVVVFFVIMLTGYLIIYNIFQISIITDIRYYGLLKTIGTTKKQIKSLVLRQAVLLSCAGIPSGLLLGFAVANVGMPVLLGAVDSSVSTAGFHLNPNPYIFLFATLFSLVTVLISCLKPGRIAGSVSPIEAAKYSEISSMKKKEKRSIGGAKLTRMALSNLRRNRRKTVFTVMSLSLSVILLTEVVTFGKSFSMDEYLENVLTGDFMIGSVSLTNYQAEAPLTLSEDFYKTANAQEGIETSARMYTTGKNVSHTLSVEGMRRFKEFYDKGLLDVHESEQYTNMPQLQGVMGENDPIEEARYAYDDSLLKKLKVLDGTFDPEKFKSGDYILVTAFSDLKETFYKPGDKVKLNYHTDASKQEMLYDKEGNFKQTVWKNDTSKEYEVMAVVELPYSMTTRRFPWNAITTVLPIEEFLAEDKDAMCFCTSYWVKDDKETAFQSFVDAYTTKIDPNTDYDSKETLRKEFSSMSGAISLVGIALSLIIGMIGVLNFINTILTSVITRKRELAMLQSIGMTDSQLKRLLIYEGLYYIAFAAVSSLVVGSVLSLSLVRAMETVVAYFKYQYTVLPYVVMLPVFFLIGILVPEIAYRKAKKQSIIVRLREAE